MYKDVLFLPKDVIESHKDVENRKEQELHI